MLKNAIYTLQSVIKQVLEVQNEVRLCLIDCTKPFHRVHQDQIITQLTQLNTD